MALRRTSRVAFASAVIGAFLTGPAMGDIDPTIQCSGDDLCIDIASDPSGGERPIDPGRYTIKIVNLIPLKSYPVRVKKSQYLKIGAPIDLPTGMAGKYGISEALKDAPANPCLLALNALKTEYDKAATELQISELNQSLTEKLAVCGSEAVAYKQQFINQTTKIIPPTTVAEQQDITVDIVRMKGRDDPTVEQTFPTYTFATLRKPPGQWLVYYGANYIYEDNEEYFAKANANATPQTYTVTEKSDIGGGTFAAGVYFMWFSPNQAFDDLCFLSCNTEDRFRGVTVGLGFDFDDPTLFVGYGVGWGYNVMLTAGVAMSKVTRLAGQYRKGDVVSETLTEDQLSDETYKPHLYLGAAIRFGANPFNTSKTAAVPDAPAPATPAPATSTP